MGCVSSKKVRRSAASSDIVSSSSTALSRKSYSSKGAFGGTLEKIKEEPEKERDEESLRHYRHSKSLKKGASSGRSISFNVKFGRLTQAEHVAAGWPAWLSAVAGDAVVGWLPLRSDIFQRLVKVEQLHKIFKVCGTPPDEYWKRSKLPLAAMFKPQHPYESTLRERCEELPKTAVTLIETFFSIEPYKRGTASSALDSEYFGARPYACDLSSLPKYPPNKEIDAKFREDAERRKAASGMQASGASRNSRKVEKPLQELTTFYHVIPTEEVEANIFVARRSSAGNTHSRGATKSLRLLKSSYDTLSEASQVTEISQGDSVRSVPVIAASSDFPLDENRILHPQDYTEREHQEVKH